MAVPEIFNTIEQTGFSTWIRESDSLFGFYFILLFHNFGLAMLVGASAIIDLRLLGVVPELPLKSLKKLFSIMYVGLAINAVTGVILVIGYPTKAFTNYMFYIKLTVIAIALTIMYKIKQRVFDDESLSEAQMVNAGKSLAKWSLITWITGITAGRLLAYTARYLYYGTRAVLLFDIHSFNIHWFNIFK